MTTTPGTFTRALEALRIDGPKRALAVLTRGLRGVVVSPGAGAVAAGPVPAAKPVVVALPSTSGAPLKISILMPVYNTPADVLEAAIKSVLVQSFGRWELCICDDHSSAKETLRVLEAYRGFDPRIKITRAPANLHIARATNLAAEFATGQFVGFLDHDDELLPHALATMAGAIEAHPDADVVYSDEDKLEENGSLSEPYLKPDWSPEHLTSVAYILHFMLVRKSLFFELGGLRHEFTGAQDYDLSLRATARARRVVHVPKVLYHWRKIAGSAAAVVDAKPQALINAGLAVRDVVCAEDPGAAVSPGLFTGSFRVEWPVDPDRPVTLLMLTDSRSKFVEGRGEILMVKHAIDSILTRSTFKNIRIVVLDNGNMLPDVEEELVSKGVTVKTYSFDPPFNFPRKINAAFDLVETEDVIILNDDIEVISEDWIEALLSHSRRERIGAVGARLLYTNDRIQHAGIVMGVNGPTTHIFHNQPKDDIAYCGYSHLVRNYSAVTGAVLATRMSLVREIGGFNPDLAIDYNDIDFCLRLGELGYRIVYTPFATLYHFEGSSLVRHSVSQPDQSAFLRRWGHLVDADPYYNPNLPRDRTDCAVGAW
ncbi:glycosyltransferase family 2 protein [Brevundimonas sp. TWP2-3-4b1]|uniref:glycosyltransferase family 2 protein n=1 Tax=Brevundimonas sp. TWP2-3-4b1 TaxID=2804580 RepID=UPI003CF6F49A